MIQEVLTFGKKTEPKAEITWKPFDPGTHFVVMAVVEPEEDGGFVSYAPNLPGAVSQGATEDDALSNLAEAIAGCLASYHATGETIPWVHEEPEIPETATRTQWIEVDV